MQTPLSHALGADDTPIVQPFCGQYQAIDPIDRSILLNARVENLKANPYDFVRTAAGEAGEHALDRSSENHLLKLP